MKDTLEELSDELESIRKQSTVDSAPITLVRSTERGRYFDVDPDEDVDELEPGVRIRVGGHDHPLRIDNWFPMPQRWDPLESNLVALIEYCGLNPPDLERLETSDYHIPVTYRPADQGWGIDWDTIYRVIES